MQVDVLGGHQLAEMSRRLKQAGRKDLDRELDKALRGGAKAVQDAVARDSPLYMPDGYELVFRASLEFKTQLRKVNGNRVTIILTATGRTRPREIRRLESGVIRHPVFGRTRKVRRHWVYRANSIANPWVDQAIRPHFFTEPAKRSAPAVREELKQAMHRVAQKIEKG